MLALIFDTLRLSQTLRDKGHFSPEQAEALAEAFSLATHEDIATKADIADIKIEIARVKAEILKWIVGAIGFQTAAMLGTIVGLVKIFAK